MRNNNDIRKHVDIIRSRSFSDVRFTLKSIVYFHFVLVLLSVILPVYLLSPSLLDIYSALEFFRYRSDIRYLEEHASIEFLSEYRSSYSTQLITTMVSLVGYLTTCIISNDKNYFPIYKDTYLATNVAFIFALFFSLFFLLSASDFGIFQTSRSWFEDNANSQLDFFPIPMGKTASIITGTLFVFIFSMGAGLIENLVVFILGRRINE